MIRTDLLTLYIGTVALAVRLHHRLPLATKVDLEQDGDPMERLAKNFNETAGVLRMVRNGKHDWIITEVSDDAS